MSGRQLLSYFHSDKIKRPNGNNERCKCDMRAAGVTVSCGVELLYGTWGAYVTVLLLSFAASTFTHVTHVTTRVIRSPPLFSLIFLALFLSHFYPQFIRNRSSHHSIHSLKIALIENDIYIYRKINNKKQKSSRKK